MDLGSEGQKGRLKGTCGRVARLRGVSGVRGGILEVVWVTLSVKSIFFLRAEAPEEAVAFRNPPAFPPGCLSSRISLRGQEPGVNGRTQILLNFPFAPSRPDFLSLSVFLSPQDGNDSDDFM